MKAVNKDSPVPLYYQIYRNIKKKITDGELKSGEILPSEYEYCDIFNVSRLTIRKALEELYREGLIVRSRGRGTFVSENKREEILTKLKGFTEELKSRGQRPSSKTLEKSLVEPPIEVIDKFGITEDTPVLFLKRLRLADDIPMAIESGYYNISLDPRILKIMNLDMENHSLYSFFKNDLELKMRYADETIEITHASEEDKKYLQISGSGESILRKRYSYLSDDRCLEYVISIYRGDKYKLKVRLGL